MNTSNHLQKYVKSILALTLIALFAVTVAIGKPAKKLTPEEIAEKDGVVTSIDPDKAWIERIMDSKAYKNTEKRSAKHAKDLEKYRDKILKGDIKCKKRINGKWVDSTATIADIEQATRLDRPWNSDPNVIDDILMHERCPLDGHLYKDDFGSDSNE
jgi:hypothetical protein